MGGGEKDFNEDVKSAIANVREEVEKIQEMHQVKWRVAD